MTKVVVIAPVEAYGRIERLGEGHTYIRTVYDKLRTDLP